MSPDFADAMVRMMAFALKLEPGEILRGSDHLAARAKLAEPASWKILRDPAHLGDLNAFETAWVRWHLAAEAETRKLFAGLPPPTNTRRRVARVLVERALEQHVHMARAVTLVVYTARRLLHRQGIHPWSIVRLGETYLRANLYPHLLGKVRCVGCAEPHAEGPPPYFVVRWSRHGYVAVTPAWYPETPTDPQVKRWKSRAAAERWLAGRDPHFTARCVIEEVTL